MDCRAGTLPQVIAPPSGPPAGVLVLGIDGGGTGVRALLADLDGAARGSGRGGGANPISRGVDAAVREIGAAVREALAGHDPAAVGSVVLGLAGSGVYAGRGDAALAELLRSLGLDCPWRLASDIEIAFAAGTPATDGIVLIAGTGAVAGGIQGGALTRQIDGYGWLIGDDGSGFWLGREALRAALAALDGRGPATALTTACCTAYGVPPGDPLPTARALVQRAYDDPPVALAALATAVVDAATDGDAVAAGILDRGADLLVDAVQAAARGLPVTVPAGPVVLVGGILTGVAAVRDRVSAGVLARTGLPTTLGLDPAAGAAWCAIRALGGVPDPAVHRRLTGA